MSDIYGASRRRIIGETWFWVVVTLVGVLVIVAVIFGVRWATAPARGQLAAREQIQSGTFRIAAYDRFFDLCAAVQSDEATIVALREELTTGPPPSRVTQINASITALRSGRAEKINRYNGDARKDYTIGQFRSNGLPYQLSANQEATTCTV
jgi:hypothetical protein